jgi:hypothetical protein
VIGEVHNAKEPPSSLHLKELASAELNLNVASVDCAQPVGPEVIETLGGVVSMSHVYVAAVLTFPAGSIAFTRKVWLVDVRLEYVFGEVQVV